LVQEEENTAEPPPANLTSSSSRKLKLGKLSALRKAMGERVETFNRWWIADDRNLRKTETEILQMEKRDQNYALKIIRRSSPG